MLPTISIFSSGDPFPQEVRVRIRRRGPEEVGEGVRDKAVDLLGHRSIKRPQACFKMRNLHAELDGCERDCRRGIDVATTTARSGRTAVHQDLLIGDHHVSGLLRMGAAPHGQMDGRIGQLQVPEERIRHIEVVVLAGMDNNRLCPGLAFQPVVERGYLHEVGPGHGDQMDYHSCAKGVLPMEKTLKPISRGACGRVCSCRRK